ncbi:hypothetical protein BGZ60DRAFT_71209 [Tricladium varicosporioides]|nr:hypothetical protein BGZ60DRAFT_71209 [Hymenoscyphus varicosporioides]
MGKNKRIQKTSKKNKVHKLTKPAGVAKPQPKTQAQGKDIAKKPHFQPSQSKPIIPFSKNDKILLVGEGDLSFSRSLIFTHSNENVTATVLESSEDELISKYPIASENVAAIEEGRGVVKYAIDAGSMNRKKLGLGKGDTGWDRIIFNFPHVGGKSKDVNRQVRYNQELLVSFFKSALPLLSPTPGSSILVTLFEGEPYTLWNIRDLGRHSGLEVMRSFRFQAAAYPGYRHARTLGVVKGKNGEVGKGWKGEDRVARTYEFVRKGEGIVQGKGKRKEESGESEESGVEDDVDKSWDDAVDGLNQELGDMESNSNSEDEYEEDEDD